MKLHYLLGLSFLIFFQTLLAELIYISMGLITILTLYFLNIKKLFSFEIFIFTIPLLSILFNLIIHDSLQQLNYIDFYRYDGKVLIVFYLLILFYLLPLPKNLIHLQKSLYFYIKIFLIIILSSFIYFLIYGNHFFNMYFTSHNASAGFIGSILILFLLMLHNNFLNIKKYKIILLTFLLFLFFLLVQSRSFTLGLLTVIILIMYDNGYLKFKSKIFWSTILLFIILAFIMYKIGVFDRISHALDGNDYNVLTRYSYWFLALDAFQSNPIFGTGFGSFNDSAYIYLNQDVNEGRIYGEYFFGEKHSHNIILQILSEQGIFGLILFFIPFYYTFRVLNRIVKHTHNLKNKSFILYIQKGYKYLFIYIFIASRFGLNFYTASTSLILSFFMAISLSIYFKLKKKSHAEF